MKKVIFRFIHCCRFGMLCIFIAASTGEGQINFTGEIIDSACQVVNGLQSAECCAGQSIQKQHLPAQASTSTFNEI